jgi:hypothetical protein
MLLVIIGAGASFDSIADKTNDIGKGLLGGNEFRPPLADDLFGSRRAFQSLQRRLPAMLQATSELNNRPSGVSLEDLLGEWTVQSSRHPNRSVQLAAARYYIRTAITECEYGWCRDPQRRVSTNFDALLDRLEAHRCGGEHPIIVTFNYDTLIELAFNARRRLFREPADYVRPGETPLIKLHGSINWIRRLSGIDPPFTRSDGWENANRIAQNISIFKDDLGDIIQISEPVICIAGEYLTIPAIAIPIKAKARFECPESHIATLISHLPNVTEMITIGWRGAEDHFVNLLGKHLGRSVEGICVAGSDDDAKLTAQRLMRGIGRVNLTPYGGGFTAFMRDRMMDRICRLTWRQ